jgi:hypothetical protein
MPFGRFHPNDPPPGRSKWARNWSATLATMLLYALMATNQRVAWTLNQSSLNEYSKTLSLNYFPMAEKKKLFFKIAKVIDVVTGCPRQGRFYVSLDTIKEAVVHVLKQGNSMFLNI